jgi:hypothetical protein
MLMSRFKVAVAAMLVLGFTVTGVSLLTHRTAAAQKTIPLTLSTGQTANEPEEITVSGLKPEHAGKEVSLTFQVEETYWISGAVPVGKFPSFGIRPALPSGAPRFSVLVSDDLAGIMERFGLFRLDATPLKGQQIQATGKITVFSTPKGTGNQEPSYQLTLRDWKKIRILPAPDAPK